MSVEGVATGETWVGPYSLLVDIQDAQPKLYVQQWNSSPAFGKIFSLNTNSLLSAGAASWSRSELNIPGGLFTTSFALAHDSAKSYVFQARYSSVGLFKSTSLNNPPKSQRAFYYQPTFDLNQLDTGLNMVTGEFYSADGQLIIVYDTINVRAAPNDQIQVLDHCFSGSTPISVVDQNGVADSRFWDFGNGDTLTSLADTVVTTYPAPNAYTITVTSANASCVSIDSFPIVINHVPISNFSVDTACAGEVVNIVNSSTIGGGDSITQWLWIFNGTDSLFGENPNFTTNQSGNLSISLISYSSAGCTDTATDSTFIKPIPSANFTLEQTCFGDSTYFYSTVPQNGGYTILWDFGDGQTAVDSSPAHLYLNAGLYAASLTVTAVNGCEIESSTPILISPTPSIDYAIPSNICQNETIELQSSITSIDSIRSVAWTVLDSAYFGQSTSILPQSFGAELCTLEVIVGTDCRVDSVFTITINQAPIASFFLNDSCLNSLKIAEDNSFIPPTQTMVFNQWTFNGTSASNQDSFLLEPQTDSIYTMEYVVTTDSNCTSVLSRPIEIVGTPSLNVDFLEPLCTDLKLKFDLDTTSGATDQVSRIIWLVYDAQVMVDSVASFSPELILPDDSQYEIWAELQTVKGCKAFDRDTISPSLSPRLNIQNDSICQFTELHLSSNYSGSNYEHHWSYANVNYANTSSIDVIFDRTGVFEFEASILDNVTMCSDTSRFDVYVGDPIQASLESDVLCRNQVTELSANISLDSLDTIKGITWTRQGNVFSVGQSGFIESSSDMFIELSVKSKFGCALNEDIFLSLDTIAALVPQISNSLGSVPYTAQVTVFNPNSQPVFHVFLGDTFFSNNISLSIDSVGVFELMTFSTNENGCAYSVLNRIIGYDNTPDLAVVDLFFTREQSQFLLNASFINNSNIEIREFEFEVIFENGSKINYTENEVLEPGGQTVFQTSIISNTSESEPLVCVNILNVTGDADENTSNNYLCSKNSPQLHIYPNPFTDGVSLRFLGAVESDVNVVLYSVNGRPVLHRIIDKGEFNPEYFLSLASINAGEYILLLMNSDFELLRKIIKL